MILAGNKDMEIIVDHCILPSQPAGTYRSGTNVLQAFHGFYQSEVTLSMYKHLPWLSRSPSGSLAICTQRVTTLHV